LISSSGNKNTKKPLKTAVLRLKIALFGSLYPFKHAILKIFNILEIVKICIKINAL